MCSFPVGGHRAPDGDRLHSVYINFHSRKTPADRYTRTHSHTQRLDFNENEKKKFLLLLFFFLLPTFIKF